MESVKTYRRYLIRDLLKGEGRTFVWLGANAGWSADHIRLVDAGERPGTQKFWVAMRAVLGDQLDEVETA